MSAYPVPMYPTILFGAFDRHNFGDLLFPHIAATLLQDTPVLFAGLTAVDLRQYGGHQVQAIARLASEWKKSPVNLMHVGGEILTCDAWLAAVMLLPPEQVQSVIARFDNKPAERLGWAREQLGLAGLAPYCAPRTLFPQMNHMIYTAVGGVDFSDYPAEFRAEVISKLKEAEVVSVRDQQTLSQLQPNGIDARLIPDPAVMVAELFAPQIRHHAQSADMLQIKNACPQGYIAMQFSADFGDDKTLSTIAAQLDNVVTATGYAVVFFRAGAAPWHDDLSCYQRVASRMSAPAAILFESLNIWDICALIADSRLYCGSSLHGRIIAMSFALPRVNLCHSVQRDGMTKQAAFAATWELASLPATVIPETMAQGILAALAVDRSALQQKAHDLVQRYRQGFTALCAGLKP